MLQPQRNPPGHSKRPAQDGAAAFVQRSQLHAASKDLCELPSGDWVVGSGLKQQRFAKCDGRQRSPDLVFMSIGGNDAGFAKVIMHTLVPGPSLGNNALGSVALAAFKKVLGTVDNSESAARAVQLKEKLPFLSKAMDERLHVRSGTVFFMQYPDPLQRPRRLLRAADSDTCGLEIRSGTEAARFLSSTLKDHWHMWGTESEFRAIRSEVIRPLHDIVRASKGHWTVVDEHLPDFLEHGLCADAAAAEKDEAHQAQMADIANIRIYGLPAVSTASGTDKEWRPAHYFDEAYNPATVRWFRTPNDSVRVQTERRVQGSMAGAFHPNGGGYARLADAGDGRHVELAPVGIEVEIQRQRCRGWRDLAGRKHRGSLPRRHEDRHQRATPREVKVPRGATLWCGAVGGLGLGHRRRPLGEPAGHSKLNCSSASPGSSRPPPH